MGRDAKGSFIKNCKDDMKPIFWFPSIKKILTWTLILEIILPWISIINKFNLPKKVLNLFNELLNPPTEDPIKSESINKMVYFNK